MVRFISCLEKLLFVYPQCPNGFDSIYEYMEPHFKVSNTKKKLFIAKSQKLTINFHSKHFVGHTKMHEEIHCNF